MTILLGPILSIAAAGVTLTGTRAGRRGSGSVSRSASRGAVIDMIGLRLIRDDDGRVVSGPRQEWTHVPIDRSVDGLLHEASA